MGDVFDRSVLDIDAAAVVEELAGAVRDDVRRFRRRGAVVGISGGVDSSVTLALCARGLGPGRVVGVLMPERESSPDSVRLADQLAAGLEVGTVTVEVTEALEAIGCYRRRDEAIRRVFPDYDGTWQARITLPGSVLDSDMLNVFHLTVISPDGAESTSRLNVRDYLEIVAASNYKQRLRMAVLYHHAEARNYCVVGTANKDEYDQGFFVKHGDGGYDIGPIRHLYKTQVYKLAEQLGLPLEIRRAVPTTDTYSAPTSQEEFFFRMPFAVMDLIWYGLDHDVPAAVVAEALGLEEQQVERAFADLARKRSTTELLRAAPVHYA